MAVVGEAHIVVRAITAGVARDIQNGVKAASGDVGPASRKAGESLGAAFSRGFNAKGSNIFQKVSDGLRTMVPDALAAAASFRTMVRSGFTIGPLIAVIIGGISSLVGAFGALIGAAGGAAGALVAVVGAALTLRVAIAGANFAMKGIGSAVQQATDAQNAFGRSVAQVNEELQQLKFDAEDAALAQQRAALNVEKARETLMKMQDMPVDSRARRDAELSFKEAELAYRRAKDRASDLRKELKDGGTSAAAANDPFAGLTPSQKTFAKFLVTLQDRIKELREAVARGFLPELQKQITKTANIFGNRLEPAFDRFGESLGTAVTNFFNAFLGGNGPTKLINLLDAAGPNIEKFGSVLGKGFETFLDILIAAQPLTDRFIGWIDKVATDFSNFIDKAAADGSLEQFFTTAGDIAADFGEIFGNVFNFLGDVIAANFGEGSGGRELLDYFKEATAGLAGMADTAEGEANLADYFKNAVENAKPLLSFLGGLAGAFLRLGENPALGETFTKMSEGLPNLEEILNKLVEAGPNLATLGNTLGDIFNALTDSEAPKVFLDTLNSIATVIRDALQNEAVAAFLNVIGRVFAFITALTLAGSVASFFGKVIVGNLIAFTGFFSKIAVGFRFIGLAIKLGPIKALTIFSRLGVGFAATALKIIGIVKKIGIAIKIAFMANPLGMILGAIALVVAALTYFFTQTELGKEIWANFTQFIGEAVTNIGNFFTGLGTAIVDGWNATVEGIAGLWEGFVGFFEDAVAAVATFFGDAWQNAVNLFEDIWAGVTDFFRNLVNGWIGLVENFINFFINGLNNMIGMANTGLGFLGDLIGQKLEIALIPNVSIPRLADGGVAMPSAGGTLAVVAEAGRPERIEPLDENGLSRRDKVLINSLGGGMGQINVYAAPDMNVTELANEVSRQLGFRMRRGV